MSAKGIAMWRSPRICAAILAPATVLAIALAAALVPVRGLAHAAFLEAEAVQAIRLTARYDTGEPMADARVVVFAPDAPATPHATGRTDARGVYLLVPGPQPGRWTVQVRQDGHGAIIHVDTGAGAPMVVATGAGAPDRVQRAVMVALVVWGALGTALYFRRRREGVVDASG